MFVVCCTLLLYTSKELFNFSTRYGSKVMGYKALCFGARYCCCLGAVAPLLLLLLSTVMCACTAVMISLVVVICRDFESQLKSSGHATPSHSF